MAVDRCICNSITFRDALVVARRSGARTVRQLQQRSELGKGCGLCVPYMQRAIESGETDLPVLDDEALNALRSRADVVVEARA